MNPSLPASFRGRRWLLAVILIPLVLLAASAVQAQLPAVDPEYEGPPVGLLDGRLGEHPRLFFDAAELAAIDAYHDSAAGQTLRDRLSSQAGQSYNLISNVVTTESESKKIGIRVLPTLALHYRLSDSQISFERAMEIMEFLMDQPYWSGGGEVDCGMPAGNLMTGAAFAYDLLHDDLEPEFREAFRERLWHQARSMYHLGYLEKNPANTAAYWQQDPQNNHRFHRFGGLVNAVIVAYTGDPSEDWLLARTIEEAEFVKKWLPPDGSNHEGISYISYGMGGLLVGAWAADENFGTNLMDQGYFKNVALFVTTATTPGLGGRFPYGDDGGGGGGFTSDVHKGIRINQLADVQAFVDRINARYSGEAWQLLAMQLPPPEGGSMENLPRNILYPDLGVAHFRNGWEQGDEGAMFKCGPMGGRRLNEYRDTHDFHYINIAHDDPDANTFAIWEGYTHAVSNAGYSTQKKSANHNTILVNGQGQRTRGEPEGMHWSQPANGKVSMLDMAFITNWKNAGAVALAEGEAVGSYPGSPLTRFRRSFIWNENKYVLIFDDIRASLPARISWLVQSERARAPDPENGEFQVATWNKPVNFQLKANHELDDYDIGLSPAGHQGSKIGLQQIQVHFDDIENLQIASIFRLWDTTLQVTLESTGPDSATVTVSGDTFTDIWTWTAAPDNDSPGTFSLLSDDGQAFHSEPYPWYAAIPGFTYDTPVWTVSTWFGNYYPEDWPWLYHRELGWLWVLENPDGSPSGWMWGFDLGWILVKEEVFPWVYQFDEGEWVKAY